MANDANEDWGWKVDLKSWVRWLIYDTTYDWLRERWKKLTMGEVIAAIVVGYGWFLNHQGVLLIGVGAVAVLSLQLLELGVRKFVANGSAKPMQQGTDGPFQIEIVDSNGQHPIPVPTPKTAEEWTAFPLKPTINQKFVRENVPLDGRNYVNCDFEQVTFWYDLTAPTALADCTFDEPSMKALHTHNPAISQWMQIIKTFGWLVSDIKSGITPLPKDRERSISDAKTSSSLDLPHEEIRFDYLPDSPTAHGWKQGYAKNPIPSDAIWKMGVGASLLMELSNIYCAIDYPISKSGSLSTRLVCDFRFSDSAMLFILVGLVTRDGTKKHEAYIKFELGREKPYFQKAYEEWVLPIDPPSLGDGWHKLDISLVDAVTRTWGQSGWTLSDLRLIRLRGHLGISPIKLYTSSSLAK